jgi:aminoacrylate hydrolase
LILGAGLNGSGEWWDPNCRARAERFTVYTFDQRGTGRSSKIPVASIEQMAADLVAVMDDTGLESAHHAGHSTGGGIGVATVLDFPGRMRSLLICSSTTCGDPYRQKLLGLRRQLYEQLGGEAYAQFRTLLLYPPYWINERHQELAAEEARDTSDLGGPEGGCPLRSPQVRHARRHGRCAVKASQTSSGNFYISPSVQHRTDGTP